MKCLTNLRVNTTKCTREEVIQEISEYFSRTGQDYLLKADETVTDAVIISEHKRLKAAGEADDLQREEEEVKGLVVVGEMCGLAVMRGAHVYAPGNDAMILVHLDN